MCDVNLCGVCLCDVNLCSVNLCAQLPRTQFTHSTPPNPHASRTSSPASAASREHQSVHRTPCRRSKSHACHAKQRQSGGAVKLCDIKLCDVKLCDVKLCDVKLCDVKLCDIKLCDVKLCDVKLCDVKLCDIKL